MSEAALPSAGLEKNLLHLNHEFCSPSENDVICCSHWWHKLRLRLQFALELVGFVYMFSL